MVIAEEMKHKEDNRKSVIVIFLRKLCNTKTNIDWVQLDQESDYELAQPNTSSFLAYICTPILIRYHLF